MCQKLTIIVPIVLIRKSVLKPGQNKRIIIKDVLSGKSIYHFSNKFW